METTLKFYVIFNPENFDKLEAFGPFKSASAANVWMTQAFNNAYKELKKDGKDVHWNWNDERLGSCKLESVGFWEIVKNSK